jgi:RNA-directed DNA polymerase
MTAKVKAIFRRNINQPLQTLIRQLNPALRGWCAYFRPGVSAATFADKPATPWAGSGDGHGANTAGSP